MYKTWECDLISYHAPSAGQENNLPSHPLFPLVCHEPSSFCCRSTQLRVSKHHSFSLSSWLLHRRSQFLTSSFWSGCLWWASLVSCFFRFLLWWSCLLICLIIFTCSTKAHIFIFQGRNVSSVVCYSAGALSVCEVPQRLLSYRLSRIMLFLCGAGEFLHTLAIQSWAICSP